MGTLSSPTVPNLSSKTCGQDPHHRDHFVIYEMPFRSRAPVKFLLFDSRDRNWTCPGIDHSKFYTIHLTACGVFCCHPTAATFKTLNCRVAGGGIGWCVK